MTTAEALRLQLDTLQKQNNHLAAENTRLKNSMTEEQGELTLREEHKTLQAEFDKLQRLYEEVLRKQQASDDFQLETTSELQERLQQETEARLDQEQRSTDLDQTLAEVTQQAEIERQDKEDAYLSICYWVKKRNLKEVVGCEGDFDELFSKARFEEVKKREMGGFYQPQCKHQPIYGVGGTLPQRREFSTHRQMRQPVTIGQPPRSDSIQCYTCGLRGHIARYKGRAAPVESNGGKRKENIYNNRQHKHIATVHSQTEKTSNLDRVQELRKKLQEAELEAALDDVGVTLHKVTLEENDQRQGLGPTLVTSVEVEGMSISALLDTGSTVSITSLEKFLSVSAHHKSQGQTSEE